MTWRAKMFIPCVQNRCYTIRDDGAVRRSRMQLYPHNERAYYLCERDGCEFSGRKLYISELNQERWVRGAHKTDPHKLKNGDVPTEQDMETMLS